MDLRSSEQLVRDIARHQLDELFPDKKYEYMIERLSEGPMYEKYIEVATVGVRGLVKSGFSSHGIASYIKHLTKEYVNAYLEALPPKFLDEE